jgi:hypothetical protein
LESTSGISLHPVLLNNQLNIRKIDCLVSKIMCRHELNQYRQGIGIGIGIDIGLRKKDRE